jgi:hypothetical protein
MRFDVISGNPSLAGNALKGGDRTAAERQSEYEHANLLDESTLPGYWEAMAMPPGPQKDLALNALKQEAQRREAESPKYWMDDVPRRPITQSDSFVQAVEVDPVTKYMTVQMNGRQYGYGGQGPAEAAEMVNSGSIGKWYNDRLKK